MSDSEKFTLESEKGEQIHQNVYVLEVIEFKEYKIGGFLFEIIIKA